MAGVRDPAFWRRFSLAVHLDEEQIQSPDGEKLNTDSWLERQQRKKKRTRLIAFLIAIAVLLVAGGVAIVIWWLSRNDWFRR